MNTIKPKNITIVGAGLAGCFMGILLAKKGYHVTIYEQFSYHQYSVQNSNRSFNLTFYRYGIDLMKKAGLWSELKPIFRKMNYGVFHRRNAPPAYSKFGDGDNTYYVVERAALLGALYKAAKKYPQISFHFNRSLLSINRHDKTITVKNNISGKYTHDIYDILIGADGVNSKVRPHMQAGSHGSHRQEYSDWTYKQIRIPAELVKTISLEPNSSHIWPGKNSIIIAFPNDDDSVTAMLLLPKGGGGFTKLKSLPAVHNFMAEFYPSMLPIAKTLHECITKNPEGSFVSIYTDPWFYKDSIALIGDAAHGVLPFYGQGVSAAFDDCITITGLLSKYHENWGKVFPEYQRSRKRNTDVLADISKDNFYRLLREQKADYMAVYDKLDDVIHGLFPRLWLPSLPRMVIANYAEFADILERHNKQRSRAAYLGIPLAVFMVSQVYTFMQQCKEVLFTPVDMNMILPERKCKDFYSRIKKFQSQNMLPRFS